MLTVYSDDHHLHHGTAELIDGKLLPPFEKPERRRHGPGPGPRGRAG